MILAISLLLGPPVLAALLFAANASEQLSLVGTLLAIFVIVSFAVVAAGWTIDHDD